jgi:hypothetical protein
MSRRDTQRMTAEQRERLTGVVERLQQERDDCGGRLPRGRVQILAPTVGIGVSTLYRYIEHGVPQPQSRPGWTWGEEEKAVLMALGGDVTATRDWLIAEHGDAAGVPDIRWMQATKHRDLAPDQIVLNEEGIAAAKQLRIVLRLESARRNELWLADHKQLDVWVIPPRGKPVKPWVTMIMDAKSRKAAGAALSPRPSQAHVLAAMQQAIERYGVPETFLFDLGMEFTANAVASVASDLVFVALPTRGYHPNHKGKIERLVQTIGRRAVRMLPQRTHQALDLRKGPRITVKAPRRNEHRGDPFRRLRAGVLRRARGVQRSPAQDASRITERRVRAGRHTRTQGVARGAAPVHAQGRPPQDRRLRNRVQQALVLRPGDRRPPSRDDSGVSLPPGRFDED